MDSEAVLHLRWMTRRDDLKALYLLRENVRYLLDKRKETQEALARHCGHQKSWINKFLNDRNVIGGREVSIADMDRIADFFGVNVYNLFQPGISALGERRMGTDRRLGRERRLGSSGRHLATLRTELDKLPHASPSPARTAAVVPDRVQRVLATAERQIAAIYAELGRQAASTGTEGAVLPRAGRKVRGPAPKPPG